jgi:hypothetical protein
MIFTVWSIVFFALSGIFANILITYILMKYLGIPDNERYSTVLGFIYIVLTVSELFFGLGCIYLNF